MLSQREKFVCHVVVQMQQIAELDEVPDNFFQAVIDVLKEGKCNELSKAETLELMKQLTAEIKDAPQIGKDVMKKMIDLTD